MEAATPNATNTLPAVVADEKRHSPWGPSSSDRWLNCAGSVEAHANAPAPESSEYADEGTVAHGLVEQLMTGRLDKVKLLNLVGASITYNKNPYKVTDEMVDAVMLHFDTVRKDFEEIKAMARPAQIQVLIENRVCASSVHPEAFGTLDSGLVQKGNTLRIYDFKYGQGKVVEAEGNTQGLQYLIAVMDTLDCEAFDDIQFVVIQPRAPHALGPVRRWNVTKDVIKAHRERMKKAIAAASVSGAPRAAGEWCRWCNAYSGCPVARAMVQKAVAIDFESVTPPAPKIVDPDALTPEQMAKVMGYEEIITKYFKVVREVAKARMERGETVPGYKLVDGKTNRAWADEEGLKSEFEDLYGEGLYEPKCLKSPARLEAVIGKKAVAKYSMKPESKSKTVAPDSDRRPATKSSAADDFKHLEAKSETVTAESELGDLLG